MKRTVYVLGNPILKQDAIPVKLLPILRKQFPNIQFVQWDPTEGLPTLTDEHLIILDSVIGLKAVTVFSDLKHFALTPRVSAHDYDLTIDLGILKKLGKLPPLTLIGIPAEGKKNTVTREVIKILQSSTIVPT